MFGKFTANVGIPGPFKIESEPYTRTIADKTEVSAGGKGGNWKIALVVIGVSAAAAGIVILKITKIL